MRDHKAMTSTQLPETMWLGTCPDCGLFKEMESFMSRRCIDCSGIEKQREEMRMKDQEKYEWGLAPIVLSGTLAAAVGAGIEFGYGYFLMVGGGLLFVSCAIDTIGNYALVVSTGK